MKNKTLSMRGLISAIFLISAAVIPARLFAVGGIEPAGFRAPFSGPPCGLPEAAAAVPAAQAYPAEGRDIREDKAWYLPPEQVDLSQVPPPPADGSAADKEDLDAVRRWQAERTAAQCAAAKAQENATYDEFFGEVSPFGNPAPEEVETIFQQVKADAKAAIRVLKELYKRPRPFLRDPDIIPCVDKVIVYTYPTGYSYPSTHSTTARVFGLILSDLVPAEAGKFMAYAGQAALNRVIGGAHHPLDIEAGKKLGDAVYTALKQSPAFGADMDRLRGNLKP